MTVSAREQEFSDRIDCAFPYSDATKAASLIAEGHAISLNAAFCVLYEIVCPGRFTGMSKQTQRKLLAKWAEKATVPIAASIAGFAEQVLRGQAASADQASALMLEVATIRGQYAALAVVTHLAYQGTDSVVCDMVDALDKEIREQWDSVL